MPKKTRQTAPLDSGKSVLRFERIITCHCFPAVLQCLLSVLSDRRREATAYSNVERWSIAYARARAARRSVTILNSNYSSRNFQRAIKVRGKERECTAVGQQTQQSAAFSRKIKFFQQTNSPRASKGQLKIGQYLQHR